MSKNSHPTGRQDTSAPRGPVTGLKPFAPDLGLPSAPVPTTDVALVLQHFRQHQGNTPELTWPEFLRILESRHRFFAEERAEREAKLANLIAATRTVP